MGWERRARGGRYYTRSYRQDGRVRREYIGTGLVAEAIAALDDEARWQRQPERTAPQAERLASEAAEAQTVELGRAVDQLAALSLLLGGYRQHHRGEWRRRRGND